MQSLARNGLGERLLLYSILRLFSMPLLCWFYTCMLQLVSFGRERQGIFWGVSGLCMGENECVVKCVKQTADIRRLREFQDFRKRVASARMLGTTGLDGPAYNISGSFKRFEIQLCFYHHHWFYLLINSMMHHYLFVEVCIFLRGLASTTIV